MSSEGHVSQVIGPVVDVDFPPGQLPALMSALKLTGREIDVDDGTDDLGDVSF